MLRSTLLVAPLAMACAATPRQGTRGPDATAEVACDVRAYLRAGTGPVAVFAGPSASTQQLGALAEVAARSPGGPILHLVAAVGSSWVRYDEVEDWAADTPAGWPGAGWIASANLAVDLAMSEVDPALSAPWTIRLRSEPHLAAPVLREYTQEPHEARVLSCTGQWLKVEVRLDASKEPPRVGWLAPGTSCWHPFTTCAAAGPEE